MNDHAEPHNAEPGVRVVPCVVCSTPVVLASDAPDEVVANPLCIEHWFTADPTEAWEAD